MSLQWSEEASSAAQELASGKLNDLDYVLFSVLNPKKPKPEVALESKGKGGRKRVAEILSDGDCASKVITGAFVASAVDERGSISSVRRKIIHVTFAGASVGVMIKGKVNGWSGNFRDPFPGCAIYLQLMGGDLDDIQEGTLEANLMSAGGAHKPTRYDFTNATLRGSLGLNESDDQSSAREDEEARIRAQGEAAKRKREEDAARKKGEAEAARKKAEEEAAQKKAADEKRRKAEADAAAKQQAEAAKKEAEEDAAKKKAEEEKRKNAEAEAEAVAKKRTEAEEAARKQREAEAARMKEEEEKKKAEEQVKLKSISRAEKAALEQNELKTKDKDFVMLVSTQSGSNHQTKNMKNSKEILKSIGVNPVIVDGSDPKEKEVRDNLFRLSGVRGNYPQFFVKSQGDTEFFGDYEVLEEKKNSGTLAKAIGLGSDDIIPEELSQESGEGRKKLILLISSMCTSQVKAEQNHARAVLEGLGFPTSDLEVLDGCDTQIKDRRNQLWGVSGIRAKYPQLFAVESDGATISFVGDYEGIVTQHDHGSLAAVIGMG